MCDMVTQLDVGKSQKKGGTIAKAFREQSFLWARDATLDADFGLVNFQDNLHAQETIKYTEGNKYIN